MFYIDHYEENNIIAVADSDDLVIDKITFEELEEYKKKGVAIYSFKEAKSFITSKMVANSAYFLFRKLNRGCSEEEFMEYIPQYSVPHLADLFDKLNTCLDVKRGCKIYDYNASKGYYIILLYTKNNFTIYIRVDGTYHITVGSSEGILLPNKYPSASGEFYSRLFKKHNINVNFDLNKTYLLLYNECLTNVHLVAHDKMYDSCIQSIPKGVILC
jgi:hypothetical protein